MVSPGECENSTSMMWWIIAGYFEHARDVGGSPENEEQGKQLLSLKSLIAMLLEPMLIQSCSQHHTWRLSANTRQSATMPQSLREFSALLPNSLCLGNSSNAALPHNIFPCVSLPVTEKTEVGLDLFSLSSLHLTNTGKRDVLGEEIA